MSGNLVVPQGDDGGAGIGAPFVIQWDDGSFSLADGDDVSRMFDLADCGQMDGVTAVLATDEHGKVVPVTVGAQERIEGWAEDGIVFARSPVMAGTLRVGTVFCTDH